MSLQTDFMAAVNQLAAERALDTDDILEAIKESIVAGFKKDNTEFEEALMSVEIDQASGRVALYIDKKVVKDVVTPTTQISLKEAQKLEPKLRVGDHVEIDVTPDVDFGRVAAQSAKQVILQKLREAEKETQIKRFVDHVGEIDTGIVQRIEGNMIYWEFGRAIAIMPQEERIPTEFYKVGRRHRVLIKEITDSTRGRAVIVTRSDPKFLEALFELEIPELQSGTIEIKGVAREAGQRSKLAVISNVEGVDPIGSCVGQKGVRIMAIMNELKLGSSEEKIDIILWDEDPIQYIVNSLSPAQVLDTKVLDETRGIIQVIVPDDQLSLAIGREGQNVRLAAKLTGWNIDIQGETVKIESEYAQIVKKLEEEKKEVEKKKTVKKEKKEVVSKVKKTTKAATKETSKKKTVAKKSKPKTSTKKTSVGKAEKKVDKKKVGTKKTTKKTTAKKATKEKTPAKTVTKKAVTKKKTDKKAKETMSKKAKK
jgi:transcription termination/antitermination protein NusA